MKEGKTASGRPYIEFTDRFEVDCSIHKSGIGGEDILCLGVKDAEPKIEYKVRGGGKGFAKYPIHEDVYLTTLMHLNIDQAGELISVLENFVSTGEVSLLK